MSQESEQDQRSVMIMDMERTLNTDWFNRRKSLNKEYCKLSVHQYWDWINYLDVSHPTLPSDPLFAIG